MSNMLVNTLVIGAGRSGTTTICKLLEQHPEVCYSKIKEIHYFSIPDLYKRGVDYFHSFFSDAESSAVIATADTYLLIDYDAIERIYAYNPNMRIVVMLRNPVDRAYSSYNYSVNYGHHKKYDSFIDSIEHEKSIESESNIVLQNNKGHFYGSLYYEHISKWLKRFGRDQILFLTTNELKNSPEKTNKKLFSFLEVKDIDIHPGRENKQAVPKFKGLEKNLLDRDTFLRKIFRKVSPRFIKNFIINSGIVDKLHRANRKDQKVPELSAADREIAMNYFKKDIEQMEKDLHLTNFV